jgi:hypothetical protein
MFSQVSKILRVSTAIALLQACTVSEEPATSEQEQAEVIEVHGCRPGFWQLDDGTCIEPPRGGGGGPGPTGGERGPGERGPGAGGGGGGGGGDRAHRRPIPSPRDCTVETDHEACMQCCDWNVDKVWGERCRRIPERNREERRLCWIDAEQRRSECQRPCPPPILTAKELP